MNFNTIFSGFLIICITQAVVIILFLLLRRKYRRMANLFLLILFILLLIHYFFFFFEYIGLFTPNHFRASAILPFQLLPPVLVYFYSYTRLYGNISSIRILLRHLLVFILGVVFFIPIIIDSFSVENTSAFFTFYSHVYRIVSSLTVVTLYLMYARQIVKLFAECVDMEEDNYIKFLFNLPRKLYVIIPIAGLLIFGGFFFLLELFISIFFDDIHRYIDFLISATLFLLSFVLAYVFTKHPNFYIELEAGILNMVDKE